MKTLYHHPVLGEITVNRSSRARRISVSVRPSGVTLTLPPRYPLAEALSFAESKRDWIEQARQRAQKRVQEKRVIRPPFHTRLHELKTGSGNQPGFSVRNGIIRVILPPGWPSESTQAQELFRKAITEAFRLEAKQLLPQRVADLAGRYGFRYTGLIFRNAVSRWGSCSARDSISLSIHLMQLPDVLIDYVILHELCHTKQKNHGPKFHALMELVTGGKHRLLDKQLKTYTPRW